MELSGRENEGRGDRDGKGKGRKRNGLRNGGKRDE